MNSCICKVLLNLSFPIQIDKLIRIHINPIPDLWGNIFIVFLYVVLNSWKALRLLLSLSYLFRTRTPPLAIQTTRNESVFTVVGPLVHSQTYSSSDRASY